MKKIFISAVVILTIGISFGFAQDVHFSQWYNAPLNLNPSLAGTNKEKQIIVKYKDGLTRDTIPYRIFAFSGDVRYESKGQPYRKKKGFLGFGINLFSDKAIDTKQEVIQGNLSMAFQIYTGNYSSLGGGIQGGLCQLKEPLASTCLNQADFSGGLNWRYGGYQKGHGYDEMTQDIDDKSKAYVGIAMFHINKPKQSFYKTFNENLNSKIIAHATIEVPIGFTNIILIPTVIYSAQKTSQEFISGLIVRYILEGFDFECSKRKGIAVSAGIQYRNKDTAIPVFMIDFRNYQIGISYDTNTSSLKDAGKQHRGIEVCLKYSRTKIPCGSDKGF